MGGDSSLGGNYGMGGRVVYGFTYRCFCGLTSKTTGGSPSPSPFIRCSCGGKMYPDNTAKHQQKLADIYQHQ